MFVYADISIWVKIPTPSQTTPSQTILKYLLKMKSKFGLFKNQGQKFNFS